MDSQPTHRCTTCGSIPDFLRIDTLHQPGDFPPEVARLEVVSGEKWDSQLRRCPACGTHFEYTYDHDSQSGVGFGFTDETIERLFWFERRANGTWTVRNASPRATGAMLAVFIRDVLATRPAMVHTITALEIQAREFGDAPAELGELVGLDLLWFKNCGLTSLPSSVARLIRLERLWIAGNPIRQLPLEIASLTRLPQVDLHNTGVVDLPEALRQCPIEFLYHRANVVPDAWRAAFVPEYGAVLTWLADHDATITRWDSGAWSHEDRYSLAVELPRRHAAGLRAAVLDTPFRIVADDDNTIDMAADGRSGPDVISVALTP